MRSSVRSTASVAARSTRPSKTTKPARTRRVSAPKSRSVSARPATPTRIKAAVAKGGTATKRPVVATAPTNKPAPAPVPAPPKAETTSVVPKIVGKEPQRFNPIAAQTTVIPIRPNVVFKVGDKCVHPAHGVGVINSIEQLELGGTKGAFYKLQIIDSGLRLLVPVNAAGQAGLRPIMSAREAEKVLDTLRAREVAVDVQPWSRRFRLYTEMVKSGLALEIAKVLRDISRLRSDKELSFGERRLLDQARGLLLRELALAKNVSEDAMSAKIAKMFEAEPAEAAGAH